MILPGKYIKNAESIIGISGIILHLLKEHKTIDELWHHYKLFCQEQDIKYITSFDNFLLGIDLLYILGVVTEVDNGIIDYATN